MKERELSLIDLAFEILFRWRSILILMLVGALLLGGFSYVSSYRISKAQEEKVEAAKTRLELEMQAAQEQVFATEKENNEILELTEQQKKQIAQVSKEWLEARLTDTQRYNVDYVLTYEKLYHEKLAYIENSVLMQMDPNGVKRAEVTFLVTSDNQDKSYNLVKIYEDLLRSGELFEAVARKVDIEVATLNELLTLEKDSYSLQNGVDTIRARVIHSNEQECSAIVEAVIDYLEEKSIELVDVVGTHELTLLTQSLVTVNDTDIMNWQRSYHSDVVNLESSIAAYKREFTEIEWQYYDFLLNGKLTNLSISKMTSIAAENLVGDADTEEDDEESLIDIINTGVTVYPGVSMGYVIVGAFLAAFAYIFVFVVLYILSSKLRVTDNLQTLYMIPQLGVVTNNQKSTKIMGFVDDWIIALRDWNKRKFTRAEVIELVSVAVKMSVEKESLQNVCLLGCDLKGLALDVCEQLRTVLAKDSVDVYILNNVLYDARAMSELQNAQSVVLVEKVGSTLYTEISQELELLNRQEIKVLGGIVVE